MRGKLIIIELILTILSCSKTTESTTSSSPNNPGTTNPPAIASKVPVAPSDIILKINSTSSITINWTDLSTNETGYKVERSINNSAFSEIASLPANSTSYIDTNINPSTIYTYRVYAFNTSGNSSYSSTINYTAPAFVVVTANSITKYTDISIMITGKILNSGNKLFLNPEFPYSERGFVWNTKPIEVNADIFANNKGSAELALPIPIESIGKNSDSVFGFYIKNLSPSTKYYFRLYYRNGGTGQQIGFSNEIVITTKPAPAIPIGESYQGGYLAYYLQPSDTLYDQNVPHGIIISPYDQSKGIEWLKYGTTFTSSRPFPNTLYKGVGYGRVNKANVKASSQPNAFPAFNICDTLTIGGYKDWVLPSSGEFFELTRSIYSEKNYSFATKNVYFYQNEYWTSTKSNIITNGESSAEFINFTPLQIKVTDIYKKKYVRAIRYF